MLAILDALSAEENKNQNRPSDSDTIHRIHKITSKFTIVFYTP
jgi:hypothetical protein